MDTCATSSSTATMVVDPVKNRKSPGLSTKEQQQTSKSETIKPIGQGKTLESTENTNDTYGFSFSSFLDDDGYINLDSLFKSLETRLSTIAEYGFETWAHFDPSNADHHKDLSNLYHRMQKFKESVRQGGLKKAETIVSMMEAHYHDLYDGLPSSPSGAMASVSQKATHGLKYMETKLSQLEELYFESAIYKEAEVLNKSILSAMEAAKDRLLTIDELPAPWRDNPYIIRGYRFSKDYKDCIVSIIKIHNETCNIWTHLLGFVVMLLIAFFHYPTTLSWKESTNMDKFTMVVFLIAAMKCLVCSTVWHTCNGISRFKAKQRFACVDYTGITVLIAASIITTEYTAFYCQPLWQSLYMGITAISGLLGAAFTCSPSFDHPEARPKRVAFFVSFAAAGVMGFIHASYLHGLLNTFNFYLPVLKSLFCYALGVVFYALLIPERWFPGGFFDYIGASHNFWHLSVFGGIYFHYLATIALIQNAKDYSCAAVDAPPSILTQGL